MISMKINELEKKENAEVSVLTDSPDYPYGLQINLDPDTFKKLGFNEAPEVGEEFSMLATVRVKSVYEEKTKTGTGYCTGFQIIEMDLKPNENEIQEEKKELSAAMKIYGKE